MIRLFFILLFFATPAVGQVFARADGAHTPYREYLRTPSPCPPLAILSHGFGGTERGMSLLANALADLGFRVIVMGHRESGSKQLRTVLKSSDRRAAIRKGAGDPASHKARFLDLDAVWQGVTAKCRPTFALMAGHSMGAQTTMMEAGAVAEIGRMGRDRFDAYIALSPQGVGHRFQKGAWADINKPVLMITGTKDHGVDGDYRTRISAFDGLPKGSKRFALIAGATHRNLGGKGAPAITGLVPRIVREFLEDLETGQLLSPRPIDRVTFRTK